MFCRSLYPTSMELPRYRKNVPEIFGARFVSSALHQIARMCNKVSQGLVTLPCQKRSNKQLNLWPAHTLVRIDVVSLTAYISTGRHKGLIRAITWLYTCGIADACLYFHGQLFCVALVTKSQRIIGSFRHQAPLLTSVRNTSVSLHLSKCKYLSSCKANIGRALTSALSCPQTRFFRCSPFLCSLA